MIYNHVWWSYKSNHNNMKRIINTKWSKDQTCQRPKSCYSVGHHFLIIQCWAGPYSLLYVTSPHTPFTSVAWNGYLWRDYWVAREKHFRDIPRFVCSGKMTSIEQVGTYRRSTIVLFVLISTMPQNVWSDILWYYSSFSLKYCFQLPTNRYHKYVFFLQKRKKRRRYHPIFFFLLKC